MGEATKLVIGILVFSIFFIGFSAFIGGVTDSYDVPAKDLESLSSMQKISNMTNTMQEQLDAEQGTSVDILDIPFFVASGAYTALKSIFDAVGIIGSLITDIITMSGLGGPLQMIGWAIMGLVSVIIVFAVLKAVLKWDI